MIELDFVFWNKSRTNMEPVFAAQKKEPSMTKGTVVSHLPHLFATTDAIKVIAAMDAMLAIVYFTRLLGIILLFRLYTCNYFVV